MKNGTMLLKGLAKVGLEKRTCAKAEAGTKYSEIVPHGRELEVAAVTMAAVAKKASTLLRRK